MVSKMYSQHCAPLCNLLSLNWSSWNLPLLFCFLPLQPLWLCSEVKVTILAKGLFVYLNPLLFLLGQGMSGHRVSAIFNETVKLSDPMQYFLLHLQWVFFSLDCTIIKDHSTVQFFLTAVIIQRTAGEQRQVITCSHCMNKSHSWWI